MNKISQAFIFSFAHSPKQILMGFICFKIRPTYSQAAEVVKSWYCHMLTGTRGNTCQSEGIPLDPQVPEKALVPISPQTPFIRSISSWNSVSLEQKDGKAVMTD